MTFFRNQWTILLGTALTVGLFGCSSSPEQDTYPAALKVAAEPIQTVDPSEKITFSLAITPGIKSRYQAITETVWTIEAPETATQDSGSTASLPTVSESSIVNFTQEILGPAPGDPRAAAALVTIDQATYTRKLPGQADLTYDSRETTNPDNPFANLIGKTYTIEISPLGYVSGVFNLSEAQQAVRGSTPAHDAALDLLSPALIFARHGAFSLPGADIGSVIIGDRWRGVQQFTLKAPVAGVEGLGTHRFDKIYRLERVVKRPDGTVAIVAFEGALRPGRRQKSPRPEIPILSYSYAGGGQFNVDARRVEAYVDYLEVRLALSGNSMLPTKGTQGDTVRVTRHFQTQRLDRE
jgi:hypothetical protein